LDLAQEEGITLFGTSAKYIDELRNRGIVPSRGRDFPRLRTLCSTGSVLVPEAFDWVYENFKRDLCLASISGGTDIISCFVLGNPLLPVYRGECQCRGLGMDVRVFDAAGRAITGEKGELVCCAPFPSQPHGFWGDTDGSRYHKAYYARFDNVWCHGDWVELTPRGGVIVYGRSDATLNPGGVRIGTAEIYRHVEDLPEIAESIAVGQEWNNDVRVILFVRPADGVTLDSALVERIRRVIRDRCSPRHVPARVLAVPEIPRTRSGKITELAVREVIHGRPVTNRNALANPEALTHFADREELRN
ncbi:MAG: acetoacetate--CoA ligase, partial [Gammaproteobacteria bacterium]|nr:acetoacetate--CoA ligase [Gammaproteobacteria bacterium]